MKKLILLVFLTIRCIANDDLLFHSATLDETKFIFWVDHKTKSAVLYSRWENFHKLKGLVSTTILTANAKIQLSENFCSYDKLVFVDSKKAIISIFPIKNNRIIFNNHDFTVPEQQLSNFFNLNQKRIDRGDALHNKAVKLNINNYSAKCL